MFGSDRIYSHLPPVLQSAALTAYGARLRWHRGGRGYRSYCNSLREMETWSVEQVAERQSEDLLRTVHEAYHEVPYYRELMDSQSIRPSDIRSASDLQLLPTMDKFTVREQGERLTSRCLSRRRLTESSSGGTTGTSTRFRIDRATLQAGYAIFHTYQWEWAGVRVGDPWVMINGRKVVPLERRSPPYWRTNSAMNEHFFSCFHLRRETIPAYLNEMARLQPAMLHLYPSTAQALARYILEEDLIGRVRPKAVITTAETLFPSVRAEIELAFSAPVFNHYIGDYAAQICQCERGGLHIAPLYGFVEFEPIPGSDVPGLCEMILTSLANRGTLLLRYRIGDTAVPAAGPCSCGRPFPTVDHLFGRSSDVVFTADGTMINASNLTDVFKDTPNIRRCQFLQERPGRMVARLEVTADYSAADEQHLLYEIRSRTGAAMELDVEIVDEIPLTAAGKFRFVVSGSPSA